MGSGYRAPATTIRTPPHGNSATCTFSARRLQDPPAASAQVRCEPRTAERLRRSPYRATLTIGKPYSM